MATKAELDLEIRLLAIEYMVCEIGKIACVAAGLNPQHLEEMRERGREKMLSETFPGMDAAMADHVGAELADRVEELLRRIETLMADSYLKARQREF